MFCYALLLFHKGRIKCATLGVSEIVDTRSHRQHFAREEKMGASWVLLGLSRGASWGTPGAAPRVVPGDPGGVPGAVLEAVHQKRAGVPHPR